jgi:hypothetical protein
MRNERRLKMSIIDPNPVVRPYGRYGFQPVAGFVEHDPKAPWVGRTQLGVPVGAQYLYGSFRSHDGKRYYSFLKHFKDDVAISFMLYHCDVGEDFQYHRGSAKTHRGVVSHGRRDDKWGCWRDEPDPRSLFLADMTSGRILERGVLDVTGKVQGKSMQWAIPDVESPLVYTSRCFKVEGGKVLDDTVSGFFFHDHQHLGIGQGWTDTQYFNRLEESWVVFATEFEDGNIHVGNLFYGKENFALAVIQRSDGPSIIASGIQAEAEVDEQGYHTRIVHHLGDDEVWEWHSIGGARMPFMPLSNYPCWVEGVVLRRGETRKWVHSEAWMERIDRK